MASFLPNFKKVVDYARADIPRLNHQQKVTRLYRRSLKLVRSWAIQTEIINEESAKLRAEFDKNKDVPVESGRAKRLLRLGEEKADRYIHPDQYVICWMPGGSKFMRNPTLPLEVIYPDGVPEGAEMEPVNINMTPGAAYERAIVDFSKKNME